MNSAVGRCDFTPVPETVAVVWATIMSSSTLFPRLTASQPVRPAQQPRLMIITAILYHESLTSTDLSFHHLICQLTLLSLCSSLAPHRICVTNIFEKQNGKWVITLHHGSVAPHILRRGA